MDAQSDCGMRGSCWGQRTKREEKKYGRKGEKGEDGEQ